MTQKLNSHICPDVDKYTRVFGVNGNRNNNINDGIPTFRCRYIIIQYTCVIDTHKSEYDIQ